VRRAAVILTLAAFAIVPSAARAQAPRHSAGDIAQARALFHLAKEQRDAGDVEGALEKFKAAHELGGTPLTGLELGRTYRMLGQLIEAREAFLAVARLPVVAEETSRSAEARREAAELAEKLEGRIPGISIVVTGMAGAPVEVSIDDVTVPSAALVAPRPVNPGRHTVVATAGAVRAGATLELREGESKTVALRLPAPAAPPSRAPRVVSYTSFGVGGAGLVAGAITGAVSFHDASVVKSACQGTVCPRSVDGDIATGRTLGTVSTVAVVFGGAGVAAGVIGLLLSRSRPPREAAAVRPWIGPGSAGIGGTF
jgi:hypothetical protein